METKQPLSMTLFGAGPVEIEMYQGVRILNVRQGSVEWLLARAGMITASRICDVMAVLKKKDAEAADRYNYKVELIAERLTGLPEEQFVSKEMLWGTQNEGAARSHYEMMRELLADTVGFGIHPDMDFAGASPDSLIDLDGGLEIKCPKTATHIKWAKAGGVPEEHQEQCLFNMDVFGREWWDFMSYDPRLPLEYRAYVVRMMRDEERIRAIRAGVAQFNEEINSLISSLPGSMAS